MNKKIKECLGLLGLAMVISGIVVFFKLFELFELGMVFLLVAFFITISCVVGGIALIKRFKLFI